MRKKLKKKWIYLLVGVALLMFFFYFQNNSLVTSHYSLESEKVSQDINGYKIVQLSDLHNKLFGRDQMKLVTKIKKENPDLIVFTGDIIDSRRYDEKPSLVLMEKLVEVAPVYYVNGNHEWSSGKFNSLEEKLEKIGVHVLRNHSEKIGDFQLIGIDDPGVQGSAETMTRENMTKAMDGIEEFADFHILLAHRPELISLYQEYDVDLIFSGHAHGGQFRIPFVGGLIAPGQGYFPKYTSGKHDFDNTSLIINRGLGNSLIPIRIFNRPEIVIVTLNSTN